MEKGLISTIQGYSIKDGPGIRSTVFCVGCNLRCRWCSNPELMLPGKKVMRFQLEGEERQQEVGYEIESRALAEKLARDRMFYAETAKILSGMGISSVLDTAGDVPWEVLDAVAENMEYVLYDVKTFDDAMHRRCTGRSNARILENLKKLAAKGRMLIIRMVIVPEYNDDLEDVRKRMELVKSLGACVKRVDILPYHTLGKGKYQRLGIPYPIKGKEEIPQTYWNEFRQLGVGISIVIAGEHG